MYATAGQAVENENVHGLIADPFQELKFRSTTSVNWRVDAYCYVKLIAWARQMEWVFPKLLCGVISCQYYYMKWRLCVLSYNYQTLQCNSAKPLHSQARAQHGDTLFTFPLMRCAHKIFPMRGMFPPLRFSSLAHVAQISRARTWNVPMMISAATKPWASFSTRPHRVCIMHIHHYQYSIIQYSLCNIKNLSFTTV